MAKKMNSFSIRELILKGKSAVREYELPCGTVLVRPLSDLEIEEAQSLMFEYIRDPETRKFVLQAEQEDLLDAVDGDETTVKKQINYNINYSELLKAETAMMLRIAYLAMRDFTDDEFDEKDLKSLNGIKGLAIFVQEISGYSKDVMEEVETFR